jgi:hypothetical protein
VGRSLASQTPSDDRALLRPRVSLDLIEKVSSRITERDKEICLAIFEHRFLTTHQAQRIFFDSYTRARTRLLNLHQFRVLERFRPNRRTGSHPNYYVLDEVGVHVVAALKGLDLKGLGYDKHKAVAQVFSPRLLHMTEVNDFFSRLIEVSRRRRKFTVTNWLGERACAARWKHYIYPDGFAELRSRAESISFWLELDGGTEIHSRLVQKLDRYSTVAGMEGAAQALLFCFPSSARESKTREVLADCGMTIATAVMSSHMDEPLGRNWLPVAAGVRLSLFDLPRSTHRLTA